MSLLLALYFLFPAVMGLEAMAQVAMALAGSTEPPSFEHVELARPVVAYPPLAARDDFINAVRGQRGDEAIQVPQR